MHKQPTVNLNHIPLLHELGLQTTARLLGGEGLTLALIVEESELTVWIVWHRRFEHGDKCLAYRCSLRVFPARLCEVLRLTVCVLSLWWVTARCPVDRKKVQRRQCLLLHRVAIATAHFFAAFNHNAACDDPSFRQRFCDVFQVAHEGCRSTEFCPLWSIRDSTQGQNQSDSLTFSWFLQFVSDSFDERLLCITAEFFWLPWTYRAAIGIRSWGETLQKHFHRVCLWWASWTTFFSNIEITYQDGLWDDCGQTEFQHSTLIW